MFKTFFLPILTLSFLESVLPAAYTDLNDEEKIKWSLPIWLILLGLIFISLLMVFSPKATQNEARKYLPTVGVVEARFEDLRIPVTSQGFVKPKNEVQLVSLVNGPVTYLSPNLRNGGYVEKNELLVKVLDRSYRQDKAKAEASLAKVKAARFSKESELRVRGTLRSEAGKTQLIEVNAAVKAAEADLEKINDLISNTQIKAPMSGIVRRVNIANGQAISNGVVLASIYSTDSVIVELPLSDRQLALLELPKPNIDRVKDAGKNSDNNSDSHSENNLDQSPDVIALKPDEQKETSGSASSSTSRNASVKIIGAFGNKEYYWEGKLLGGSSGRNESNGLHYVSVEIQQPANADARQVNTQKNEQEDKHIDNFLDSQEDRPFLSSGFFVQAEIDSRLYKNVIRIPRRSLKTNEKVWGLDSESRLVKYDVDILSKAKDELFISSGLPEGTRVVVSDIEFMATGLEVKAINFLEESDKQLLPSEEGNSSQDSGQGPKTKSNTSSDPNTETSTKNSEAIISDEDETTIIKKQDAVSE